MEKDIQTHYRACHLCEAICGLEIRHRNGEILSIRGDKEDPLSRGHFCPKSLALKDIQNDPDRLCQPLKRVGSDWKTIGWDEALQETVERLVDIRSTYGPDSIGVYLGNPCVHNYGMLTHNGHFLSMMRTHNRFSATSVDQLPHHIVGYWMYGHQLLIPIPDIDQTEYFLMIGANPLVSNGSLMTVPDVKKRIKSLKSRGGKLVVIDPRRSETAQLADEHHFIRPGTDTLFLAAILNTLIDNGLSQPTHLRSMLVGFETITESVKLFTPERAATVTGIDALTIRRIARELAKAKCGVCYGRMGVSVQSFGTLCQWLIQLINIATGNLDRVGGTLFTRPAFDSISNGSMKPGHLGKWHSRVSGLPEFANDLPVAVMAEEMLTKGEGQIKAMFTAAANPVLTTCNGRQLEKALDGLDFMVSLDPYLNETTRFADIILPPTFALEHDHFDISFNSLAVRNYARYSQPLFPKPEGAMHDWEIYTALGKLCAEKLGAIPKPDMSPDQMLDFALQMGPYGSQTGHSMKLSLERLKLSDHGIDLGPLQPSLPDRLQTADKKINCAPELMIADLKRAESELIQKDKEQQLVLISRRHLFSANSWLHNYHRLVKGHNRCLLFMHPEDMADRQISDGQTVTVTSRVGEIEVEVKATEETMKGVVNLPHGWGHNRPGTRLSVANKYAGVSINDLTDEKQYDPISGNAAFSSVPVTVSAFHVNNT